MYFLLILVVLFYHKVHKVFLHRVHKGSFILQDVYLTLIKMGDNNYHCPWFDGNAKIVAAIIM